MNSGGAISHIEDFVVDCRIYITHHRNAGRAAKRLRLGLYGGHLRCREGELAVVVEDLEVGDGDLQISDENLDIGSDHAFEIDRGRDLPVAADDDLEGKAEIQGDRYAHDEFGFPA